MSDEPDVIAKRDWRLQAITTLAKDFVSPGTGRRHPAGTPVWATAFAKRNGAPFQFALPNAVAMYLSMANRALSAGASLLAMVSSFNSPRNADGVELLPEGAESAFLDAIENLAAAVIFAYSAIEAFANESIPDNYTFQRLRDDGRCTEVYTKDQIERVISLDTKLDEILPAIYSVQSPKGTMTWERYVWLKNVRDRLIHLKSADWRKSGPENADQILITCLLHRDVATSATVAARAISHYCARQKPRWMTKGPFRE